MKNSKAMKISYTAILIALLIVVQYVTKPLGQFVTGSLVNLILISAVVLGGVYVGVIVAIISPFMAFLFNIGPAFIQIIPVIAIGNLVIVLAYHFILAKSKNKIKWVYAIIAGAVLKYFTLFIGVNKIAVTVIPNLKEKQIAVLSAAFGWSQLVTALIGGFIAFLVVPVVYKALNK